MANVPYTNANAPNSRVNERSEIPGQSRTVSPKTIDYHLASIYRKLEIRSRVQLAALLARSDVSA